MRLLFSILLVLIVPSCVTVPANSPELNQRVSDGIIRLKQQHIITLDKVYELSISKVNADYDKIFNQAITIYSRRNGKAPSTESDFKVVSIIAANIRDRILKRIKENEEEVKAKIEENYNLVSRTNDEITLYLHSAARFAQARDETVQLINKLTGVDFDIGKKLLEVDSKVDQIMQEELQK